jgi:hypothetical protein
MSADIQQQAEQIREMGAMEFHDSNHAHDTLVNLADIIAATQETIQQIGEKIREAPGITNDYAEAADEAAGQMSGIADQLQEQVGQGIVQS